MPRRLVAALAWTLVLFGFATGRLAAGERPNIVFILADDLGVNDLGCYGRQDHATPRLDALAQQGLRFTSAYCAQPICSASRAAIMTGKPPAQLHLTTFLPGRADAPSQLLLHPDIERQLPLAEVTIAEALREAGYSTACIGKWHLGGKGFSPLEQGFDVYYEGNANTEPTADEGSKGEFDLTRQAIEFIETQREKPFFLYLSHNSPHIPFAALEDHLQRHEDAFNPTYAAVVESLDASVGLLLDRLDELGLAENTLVVFTSDNGGLHVPEGELTPATHNTPFRAGKGYLYEGGLRIPLIARWRGKIPAGRTVDRPVSNVGWYETLAALGGAQTSDAAPYAIAELLPDGKQEPSNVPFYWHFPHYTNQGGRPGGAIRDGDWKLLEHYEDERLELYDLTTDSGEANECGAEHPERVAELRGKLEAWRREVGAQENKVNPEFAFDRWQKIYGDVDSSSIAPAATFRESRQSRQDWRRGMNDALKAKPGGGAVILHARDAHVHGEKLRYEPEPHKDTLGYWVNPDDWAEWTFTAPTAGEYVVEILQGCGPGSGGAKVELRVGDQALSFTVEETGHFQRFVPRQVGSLTFASPGPHTLTVRAKKKPNVAVMDLRRVTLRAVAGK